MSGARDSAQRTTLADGMRPPLKDHADTLDTGAEMRLQELKLRVQRADYVVDPALVAAAMLRRALSQRRCWNPRVVCAMPSASSTTSGGPPRTAPIHVSAAADSATLRSPGATQPSSS